MPTVTVEIGPSLLQKRQEEWQYWNDHPQGNPLIPPADFAEGEVLLENELCVYSQQARYSDGLAHAGIIVPKRRCPTVFDLTPAEAAATHELLGEVKSLLDQTVKPDGYTIGWNVYPAGGAHIPHAHLHVIPRWNTDRAAGVGLRFLLKAAARAQQ